MSAIVMQKERFVKKHNAAIRSYSEMSLLERKVANALLHHAYHDLMNQNIHEISISQLLNLLSMKTNDYQKLKQVMKQLMSTIVEWNVAKKDQPNDGIKTPGLFDSKENWHACALLASVQVNGTLIKYEYSQTLREFFYRPSFYSKISLTVQSKFKSAYSLSLYENCLSYLNCRTSGWLNMQAFRKLMGVNDMQYKIFRDFNRRVLKPAVLEVNKVSNIDVDYEIKKVNKAVSYIKLCISNKEIEKEEEKLSTNDEHNLIDFLLACGVSKTQVTSWKKQYGLNYLEEKINLIKESKIAIKNPAAFLRTALRENYQKSTARTLVAQKDTKETYLQAKAEEVKTELLKNNYQLYVDAELKRYLSNIGNEVKSRLKVKLEEYYCKNGSPPFWKRAQTKLGNECWEHDSDIFSSFKTCFVSNNLQDFVKIPQIKPFHEYTAENMFS